MIDTPMLRRAEAGGDIANAREDRRHGDPRRPSRNPRRDRRDVRVPLLRRSGLHHRPGGRRQRRHGPVNAHGGANGMTESLKAPKASARQYPKPPEGTWTEHYPELGHRAGVLRELDLARVLRARARGHLQAGLAERRARRAAPAKGRLLHQGARGREDLADHRPGHGRRDPRLPQRLPPPRQQAGVDRPPGRGDQRNLPAVRLQVPRLDVRPRRTLVLHPPGGRVLRDRQGRLRPRAACTATCGRGSSS